MIALLDADILVYRIGFTTQEESESLAKVRLDEAILDILADLKTTDYRCFLSPTGKKGFRYQIYPDYKAHRKAPKPVHYDGLRNYLLEFHKALMHSSEEADDYLGMSQRDDTCIVSIDKDLNQIPGWHYNFVTKIKYFMEPLEAMKCFYIQLLMGDNSDNIPGIPQIGIKTATRIIDACKDERGMLGECLDKYREEYRDNGDATLIRNARLLKIKGTPEYLWESKSR